MEAAPVAPSAATPGRQAYTAAHEYCHYLKDRYEGPLIDNPDVFVDEYVSLYHPREKFAQTFAAGFLMPASKVRAIIEKEFGGRKLNLEHVLYLKRYFGVSFAAPFFPTATNCFSSKPNRAPLAAELQFFEKIHG